MARLVSRFVNFLFSSRDFATANFAFFILRAAFALSFAGGHLAFAVCLHIPSFQGEMWSRTKIQSSHFSLFSILKKLLLPFTAITASFNPSIIFQILSVETIIFNSLELWKQRKRTLICTFHPLNFGGITRSSENLHSSHIFYRFSTEATLSCKAFVSFIIRPRGEKRC